MIGLSEQYHIMTPYTSLLVLESDADRARFKVKRGFQMRDGEKFFAEGRDRANYELVQQQMKRAGNWRIGLRRTVLQELAGLGRIPFGRAVSEVRIRRLGKNGMGHGRWHGGHGRWHGWHGRRKRIHLV